MPTAPVSKDLAYRILFELDPRKPLDRGALRVIRDHQLPKGPMNARSTHPLAKHIDEVLSRDLPPQPKVYQRPWEGATSPVRPGKLEEPLTAADLEWLRDAAARKPSVLSTEETRRLAQLAKEKSSLTAPFAERVLVERAWTPVREYHDRLAQVSELQAKVPPAPPAGQWPAVSPAVPASAWDSWAREWAGSLSDLVEAEMAATPGLTESEAAARLTREMVEPQGPDDLGTLSGDRAGPPGVGQAGERRSGRRAGSPAGSGCGGGMTAAKAPAKKAAARKRTAQAPPRPLPPEPVSLSTDEVLATKQTPRGHVDLTHDPVTGEKVRFSVWRPALHREAHSDTTTAAGTENVDINVMRGHSGSGRAGGFGVRGGGRDGPFLVEVACGVHLCGVVDRGVAGGGVERGAGGGAPC
jgi:hypothetical protein